MVYTMTKLALPADTDREAFGDLVTKRLKCIQFSNHSQKRSNYNRCIDFYQLIISYKECKLGQLLDKPAILPVVFFSQLVMEERELWVQ